MSQIIGVQGVGLPNPFGLYPTTTGVPPIPNVVNTNALSLPPGGSIYIPSGRFFVGGMQYSSIQVLDPVTQTWMIVETDGIGEGRVIESDGANYRIWNPLGYPICSVVTVSGTGYTSAPTVAASIGGSTWTAVVGGAVATLVCNSANTSASGVGYSLPPIINIAAPASPGVPATAVCTISGGKIATMTIIDPGAGYASVPTVTVVPNPLDLNFASTSTTATTNATVTATVSYAGNVTAVLLTNPGTQAMATFSWGPSLGLSFTGGGGSGVAATAVVASTIASIGVVTGGSGYPTAVGITTTGGSIFTQTSGTGCQTNSGYISTNILPVPRQAMITAVAGSGTGVQVGVIIDGGIFTATPTAYAVPGAAGSGSGGTGSQQNTTAFGLTMGTANDRVFIQPL